MYSPDGSGERVMQPSLQFLNGAHFLTMTFDRLISKVCHCCIMKSEVCKLLHHFVLEYQPRPHAQMKRNKLTVECLLVPSLKFVMPFIWKLQQISCVSIIASCDLDLRTTDLLHVTRVTRPQILGAF